MSPAVKLGDFTDLADAYAKYRPAYSTTVLTSVLSLVNRDASELDFVDVGAGTGIWTRMVASRGCRSAIAIEPNDAMRSHGIRDSAGTNIMWRPGDAERTRLDSESCDLLTMASALHWVDFTNATREFARVLRRGGRFVALWNPRYIEASPLLMRVEAHLHSLKPNTKRVSSGRSGLTENLTEKLWTSPYFDDVIYIEGRHAVSLTPAQYLGAWSSVNDLQVQLGDSLFASFLSYVATQVDGLDRIEATYLTRSWAARRK